MKDHSELIRKLEKIANDMHWPLMAEAAMAIRELQQDAARYRWLRWYFINEDFDKIVWDVNNAITYNELDQAIDAAMKGTE